MEKEMVIVLRTLRNSDRNSVLQNAISQLALDDSDIKKISKIYYNGWPFAWCIVYTEKE